MTEPSPSGRLLMLRVLGGAHAGAEAVVGRGHFMVGRASHCEVLLRDEGVPEVALVVLGHGEEVLVRDLSDGVEHEVLASGIALRITDAVSIQFAVGADEAAIRSVLDSARSGPVPLVPQALGGLAGQAAGASLLRGAGTGGAVTRRGGRSLAARIALPGLLAAACGIAGWQATRHWTTPADDAQGSAAVAAALRIVEESGLADLRLAVGGADGGLRLVGYAPTLAALESLERRFAGAGLRVDARREVHVAEGLVERVRALAAPQLQGRAAEVRHVGGGVVEILASDCSALVAASALVADAGGSVAGLRRLTVAAPAGPGCGQAAGGVTADGRGAASSAAGQVRLTAVVAGLYFEAGGVRYLQGGAYGPWNVQKVDADGVWLAHREGGNTMRVQLAPAGAGGS
jgi:hypothetical protein